LDILSLIIIIIAIKHACAANVLLPLVNLFLPLKLQKMLLGFQKIEWGRAPVQLNMGPLLMHVCIHAVVAPAIYQKARDKRQKKKKTCTYELDNVAGEGSGKNV
jgi:hypothetical protein